MQPGVLLPQGRSLCCMLGSLGRWSFWSLGYWPSEASANNGFMFHHIQSSPLEADIGPVLWPLQWCARVAEMRSPILQMTPACLLLQAVARKLLVKCLLKHQGVPPCPVLPALFLFWRYRLEEDCGSPLVCVPWAAVWQCTALVLALQSCHPSMPPKHLERHCSACCSGVSGHKGSHSMKQQAADPSGWCQPFWGKPLAVQKEPASPFPWEKWALTHFLYTANTFTTLELPECLMHSLTDSSSPLESLLYLYAKTTNTSSVMAIFTYRLYFTAVQKKCAIWVKHIVFSEVIAISLIIQSAPIALMIRGRGPFQF